MNKGTKERYDAFITNYHQNGNNGAEAAVKAGYAPKTAHVKAAKLLRIDYIQDKLKELQEKAASKFDLSLEARYAMLNTIYEAGLEDYIDAQGNSRRENISASLGAVKELNIMLGVTEGDDNKDELTMAEAISKLADSLPS